MTLSSNDQSVNHSMKLQIRYGSDLHEICLMNKQNKFYVQNILDQIEKDLKVPICHQSLIFKGQRLDQQTTTNLNDLYIFNNSKLILTGTQQQFHNKYCCPDHEHQINTITINLPNKQESSTIPNGFTPEPNKNYEYYTVPYKTDLATLFQTISPSTSNVH